MADLRGSETQVNVGRKYKSRKERPCDACRKRKICCTRDAYEKDCSLCRTRGESCQYILPPNVRRNRPSAARPSISTSSSSSSSSVPSRPAQTVAEHAAAANPSKSTTGKWICEFVGFSSDQDPFVLRHCSFNHHNCYKSTDWAVLRVKGDSEIPLHFTVVPDTHLDTHPEYYPTTDTEAAVSPNGPNLLRTYFDVIHLSYPLLDPSRFNSRPQTGDPLLAVMYNLAAPYCQTSPATFSQISSFVHQALPVERRHPRLETLEASLLHLQRHTTIYRSHTLPGLWSDVGALVGMAHDLGLNMDPTAWSLSAADSNRRIRIWWGLYIQDKWSALGLGRPSYLNDENCNVPLPTVDNFSHVGLHSEPLGLMPAVQFVAMANLATILSDLLNTFYTMKAMERIKLLPIEMLYSILNEFQGRLHVFHDEHLCQLYNVNTLLDSSGSVLLAYYTSEIVLFRAMLRCLPLNHPGYGGIRAQAKTTLLAVVDFLENLNVSRLRAFWWSPMTRINFSLVGTFMFFQLLTSITAHDIEFWSTTIAHYRSLLRLQSHSFDMTKLASARMDLLAAGIGVDPPMPTPDTLASSPDGTALSPTQGFMGGGVGLIGNPDGRFGQPELNGSGGERKLVLGPQAAEEWISRQGGGDGGGHTGLLGSAFGNTCMR